MAKAKKGRPMQAVTHASSIGDQLLFFSSTSKSSDASFSEVFAKESQTTPTETTSEPQANTANRPTEGKSQSASSETNKTNEPPKTNETDKEGTATKEETTNKEDTANAAKITKEAEAATTTKTNEANKKSEAATIAKAKTAEEEKIKRAAKPVATFAEAQLKPSANTAAETPSDQSISLKTKWTEIPPPSLRIAGKPVDTPTPSPVKEEASPESLKKDLADLATLMQTLNDKTEITPEKRIEINTLISKISQRVASLKTEVETLPVETQAALTTLKNFKDLIEPKTEIAMTKPTEITPQIATSKPDVASSIASLLEELQGQVETVKKTETFKTEIVKGIDLSQRNTSTQATYDLTKTDTSAPVQIEAVASSLPDTPIADIAINAQAQETGLEEKAKAPTDKKIDTETIKPLFSDRPTFPIQDVSALQQSSPAATAKPELAGAPQVANIEKQTAILSQFTTFMAVNKLRAETEVTIRLHPRELGDIKIQITRIENQATHEPATISAKFQVNSEMVKSVLESNFNLLKDSLQQQGNYNMAQMSVDVQTNGSGNQGPQDPHENQFSGQSNQFSNIDTDNRVAPTPTNTFVHQGDLDRVA